MSAAGNGTAGASDGEAVVLGVDLGTTATKVVAATSRAEIHARTEHSYPLRTDHPGEAMQDPQEVSEAAFAALAECVAECGRLGKEVRGISLTGAMHTLLGLDAAGVPVTPSVSWADNRGRDEAVALRDTELGRRVHQRTGTPVHPFAPLSKLAWYRNQDPATAERVAHWCGIKDYVLAALTGRLVTEYSMASGTGLLDIHELRWNAESLEFAGVRVAQLPELVAPTEVLSLSADAAGRVGLAAGLPVVAGGGDGPMANLGVGAVEPGSAALSLGTSGALRVVATHPGVDARCRTFCYALAGDLWVVGGAVSNGGIVGQWASEIFDVELTGLMDEARRVRPGSEGLLALPYLLGERAPWWDPDPRGMVLGLRREHGRAEVTRAVVEGVAQQIALVRDAVRDRGADIHEVRATGGGFRSAVWGDAMAASLETDLRLAEGGEGSGLGAVLLGWHALGEFGDLAGAADLIEPGEVVRADPDAARRMSAARPLVEHAYNALRDLSGELVALE